MSEGHQFAVEIVKLVTSGLVQIVAAVALYHSTPKKKDGA
jgi:hypothetical protein